MPYPRGMENMPGGGSPISLVVRTSPDFFDQPRKVASSVVACDATHILRQVTCSETTGALDSAQFTIFHFVGCGSLEVTLSSYFRRRYLDLDVSEIPARANNFGREIRCATAQAIRHFATSGIQSVPVQLPHLPCFNLSRNDLKEIEKEGGFLFPSASPKEAFHTITPAELAGFLFDRQAGLQCVIIDACASSNQSQSFMARGLPYVISLGVNTTERSATVFPTHSMLRSAATAWKKLLRKAAAGSSRAKLLQARKDKLTHCFR